MRTLWLVTVLAVAGCSSSAKVAPPATHEDPQTVFDCVLALSTERQLLAHNSVGYNILDKAGGLRDLLEANAAAGVAIVSNPANAAAIPAGRWGETVVQSNGNPLQKIDDFDAQFRTRFGGQLTHGAFKFCFVDFGASTNVDAIWAHYQAVMDPLETDFPGRIIHWTVPLNPGTDPGGNAKRDEMSSHIRAKYGGTGRVFDLASLEARDDLERPVTSGGVPAMADRWSVDPAHGDGHLNDDGAHRVALAYLTFMCGLR